MPTTYSLSIEWNTRNGFFLKYEKPIEKNGYNFFCHSKINDFDLIHLFIFEHAILYKSNRDRNTHT